MGRDTEQTDHALLEKRRHLSITDVRSLVGTDTDHYLLDAKVRERLSVSKGHYGNYKESSLRVVRRRYASQWA
jgi:hypothetical protein